MTDRHFLIHIIFKYLLFAFFLYFTVDSLSRYGWGFMPILFAIFATKDFVQGTRLVTIYYRFKSNRKE